MIGSYKPLEPADITVKLEPGGLYKAEDGRVFGPLAAYHFGERGPGFVLAGSRLGGWFENGEALNSRWPRLVDKFEGEKAEPPKAKPVDLLAPPAPEFAPGQKVWYEIRTEVQGEKFSRWIPVYIVGMTFLWPNWSYVVQKQPSADYYSGTEHIKVADASTLRMEQPT